MIVHNGIKWKEYQGALLPDVPPHQLVDISDTDIRYLLKTSGAYFLRWVSDFDRGTESEFWYVINGSACTLEELSSNTRSKIRRGLKKCSARKVDVSYIAENAYSVYRKAFERYEGSQKPISEKDFSQNIRSMDSYGWLLSPPFDNTDMLIAYTENRVEDNTCNYAAIKFDPEGLKLYSSYALFFEMNNSYLSTLKYRYVNDGARSIYHDTNIQNFLIDKFKFRKAYCRLHIAYRSDIKFLIMLCYPLRSVIGKFKSGPLHRVSVLLRQEEIRRSGEYC